MKYKPFKLKTYDAVNEIIDWIVRAIAIILILFVAYILYYTFVPVDKTATYHEGDTWIVLDGTNIDYPVVQGKDNFEYLDKDADGEYYVGGAIFLDYRNDFKFTDDYNVVYGHNMAGGKMFGDVKRYYKKEFFDENKAGMLFTPSQNYTLEVVGIMRTNAYKPGIYHIGKISTFLLDAFATECTFKRGELGEHVVALSTCSASYDDNRDVLFCNMYETDKTYRENEEEQENK